MELSLQFRKDLRRLGYRQDVEVRACSKCGKVNNELPKDTVHPFYEKVIEARRQLEMNRKSEILQNQLHNFISRLHHTSKCCGYRYSVRVIDKQAAMWELWLRRKTLVLETANSRAKEAKRLKSMLEVQREAVMEDGIYVPEFTQEDMDAIRRAAGASGKRRDDDFLIMNRLMCVGDFKTSQLIKIFRAEEARQADAVENPGMVIAFGNPKKPDKTVDQLSKDSLLAALRA